jgi:hypothetical protein
MPASRLTGYRADRRPQTVLELRMVSFALAGLACEAGRWLSGLYEFG